MYYLVIQKNSDRPIVKEFETFDELKKECVLNNLATQPLSPNAYFVYQKTYLYKEKNRSEINV